MKAVRGQRALRVATMAIAFVALMAGPAAATHGVGNSANAPGQANKAFNCLLVLTVAPTSNCAHSN